MVGYTELPFLIGENAWELTFDQEKFGLNDIEKVLLEEYIKRIRKVQLNVEKFALRIPNYTSDASSCGYKNTHPIIYSILSAESVVKAACWDYWITWYPTMDELNLLLEKLDELLQDPFENYRTWVLRKNVIKLILRLKKVGRA